MGEAEWKLFTSEIHGAEEADIPLDWTWTTSKESGQKTKFASSFSMDEPRHLCGSLSLSLPLSPSLSYFPSLSLLLSLHLPLPVADSLTCLPLSLYLYRSVHLYLSLSLCLHRSVSHLLCVDCARPRTRTVLCSTAATRTWANTRLQRPRTRPAMPLPRLRQELPLRLSESKPP